MRMRPFGNNKRLANIEDSSLIVGNFMVPAIKCSFVQTSVSPVLLFWHMLMLIKDINLSLCDNVFSLKLSFFLLCMQHKKWIQANQRP